MKVMKFGGTSVGSVNSILSVKRIVESASAGEPVIVVVSALGGITDKLRLPEIRPMRVSSAKLFIVMWK